MDLWINVWRYRHGSSEKQQKKQAVKKQAEDEEERVKAENLFVKAIERAGQFERAISELDEIDDATARRLLGWAICKGKPPGEYFEVPSNQASLAARLV